MSQYNYHRRRYRPKTPRLTKTYSIKRPYPQRQMEQVYVFVEETIHCSHTSPQTSVKNPLFIVASTTFILALVTLVIALAGLIRANLLIIGMAAILAALLAILKRYL